MLNSAADQRQPGPLAPGQRAEGLEAEPLILPLAARMATVRTVTDSEPATVDDAADQRRQLADLARFLQRFDPATATPSADLLQVVVYFISLYRQVTASDRDLDPETVEALRREWSAYHRRTARALGKVPTEHVNLASGSSTTAARIEATVAAGDSQL